MQKKEPNQAKYNHNLKSGRLSDAQKYTKAKETIDGLMYQLGMSINSEDKQILPLAKFWHEILSVIDDNSVVCADTVKRLYEKDLFDVDQRLYLAEVSIGEIKGKINSIESAAKDKAIISKFFDTTFGKIAKYSGFLTAVAGAAATAGKAWGLI